MNEELDYLSELFQVNVVLWEGRHLALSNSNSKVVISIDKNKKIIYSKNNKTDCPYYNDYCIFPFQLPLNVLLDKILSVKVYQKSASSKLIGSFSVELATVWSQPNHQFYHKWAVLVDPKNPAGGVKGFLKCDIVVLAEGVTMKPGEEGDGILEDNLLVPYGGIQDRIRTRMVLSVFRADGFPKAFIGKLKLTHPYIRITYGGNVKKTRIAKNKGDPIWNEEISFPDFFPPLMQTIFIELCDLRKSQRSLGNTTIDIRSLYESGNDGFLPTFGPNFLYLYQPLEEYERHKNCCKLENSFTYACRLLLSLRTEVIDKFDEEAVQKKKRGKVGPKVIPPLTEKMYFEYKKFILFAAIFDALLFDSNRSQRKIKIQLIMGPKDKGKPFKIKNKKKVKFPSASKKKLHAPLNKKFYETLNKKPYRGGGKRQSEPTAIKQPDTTTLNTIDTENLEKKSHNRRKKKSHERLDKKSKNNSLENSEYPSKSSKPTKKKKSKEYLEIDVDSEEMPREISKKQSHELLQREYPSHLSVITKCDSTPGEKCAIKENYSYLTFSGNFPCINIFGEWPDSFKRMYCCNVIKKAVQNCTKELNEIKTEFKFQTEDYSIYSQKLKSTLAHLSESCEHILLMTRLINLNETNLSRERHKVYHKEIADIAHKTKMASRKNELKTEDELNKISTYLERLTKYAQDPENSFPNTEIWLLRNKRIEAQYRIKTEDLAFSHNLTYRGIMSGKTQTIIFKGRNGKIKGKLEIFVWFGLASDFDECLKMLPEGSNQSNPICSAVPDFKIPARLICDEKHFFQCKAYIFQGKIFFGFDSTGLTDPFVRVIIQGQNKRTKVRKKTLSPIWDETLIFSIVTLYGSSEFIKQNPPCITVEVFDQDRFKKTELIGRCFVKPLVNFKTDNPSHPPFPLKLKWEPIDTEVREVGQILMAAELLELSDTSADIRSPKSSPSPPVPEYIRPHNIRYRLDLIFWGVRPLQISKSLKNKMFVIFECGEHVIKSPILHNVRHKLNFSGVIQNAELDLPEEIEYAPPFNFKLFHIGSMSHKRNFVATCMVPSIRYLLLTQRTYAEKKEEKNIQLFLAYEIEKDRKKIINWWKTKKFLDVARKRSSFPKFMVSNYCKCGRVHEYNNQDSVFQRKPRRESHLPEEEVEEITSWWLKYNLSEENQPVGKKFPNPPYLKIYQEELEAQPEFIAFQDYLQNYNMMTGHDKKTKGGILVAKVKVVLKLQRCTRSREKEKGLLITAFNNKTLKFLARVYIVCGKNLAARDIYGKSDPYLNLQLGKHTISDRENYAPKQLNPTFGKCFEFHGVFPHDYLLRIQVLDRDAHSRDDLIGETTIDLENRYYSKFHATCGLSSVYQRKGSNAWRDIYLPSEILRLLCKQLNLKEPEYTENQVMIEGYTFATPVPDNAQNKAEIQSLMVLKNWHEFPVYGFHLVPEHVETRSLYHPELPGIEQGKLILWVDIFPADFAYMPPKVDITPQPPVAMELRAIIWNVVDVVLDDKSVLFNGRLSDIYVKGWILSLEEQIQKTDIHYRSLNGEGNFNWRFIFQFNYIPSERRMTIKKKIDAFDMNPEERKIHCKLEIQVWDNDAFGDDFLGTLILELCSMPKGAKMPSRCTLKMLAPNANKINLFNIKKTRGWWPFRRLKMKETVDNEFELTGKIDLELEILTEAEALKSPAGKGREDPNGLPPPNRPDISADKILNPMKAFRYIAINRAQKWMYIAVIVVLATLFVLVAFYALPNYTVKRLLHA